jgi:HEAT repeat protein
MATVDQLPDLIRGLSSPNPAVRTRCAKDLGKLGLAAKEAFSALVVAVDDPDQPVREAAVHALGGFGVMALSTLVGLLMHHDKYVRRNAVWAIGKLGAVAKSALPALCQALRDEDPRTASGAAQALGSMGEQAAGAVAALAEAMRGTNVVLCRLAAKALSQVGRPALSTLISHLKHHDPFVRGEAAVAIGWIGPAAEEAIPVLIDMVAPNVAHRTPLSGSSQVAQLSGTATPLAIPQASASTDTTNDTARSYAVQALGRIGPAASCAVPTLLHAVDDVCEQVRQMAEVSLRQIQE